MKRIVTVQDISCVGRCSLTVALPIISAAGVETGVVPTAVLSTHTMFPKFTFHDLTDEIEPIVNTFKELSIDFDALYTGYLGSFRQIELVENFYNMQPIFLPHAQPRIHVSFQSKLQQYLMCYTKNVG